MNLQPYTLLHRPFRRSLPRFYLVLACALCCCWLLAAPPVNAQGSTARDATSLYRLGQQQRLTARSSREVSQAENTLLQAARQGHLAAQTELGTLYYLDFPDSPRHDSAHYWWQTAARSGEPRAQHLLGLFYLNGGSSGQPDRVRAYAWISLAVDADLPEALDTLRSLEDQLSPAEIVIAEQFKAALPVARQSSRAGTAGRSAAPTVSPTAAPAPVPPPEPAPPPEALPAEITEQVPEGFFVQTGALADPHIARREMLRIHARLDQDRVVGGYIKPLINARGNRLYRVLTGPYSQRSGATGLCNELKAMGEDCFVVSEFPGDPS